MGISEEWPNGGQEWTCSTIAGHATYFVGGDDWGFAVWAHNKCEVDYSPKGLRKLGKQTGFDKAKLKAMGLSDSQITKVRQLARKTPSKPSDPQSKPLLEKSKRSGTQGDIDHQNDVKGKGRAQAEALVKPGERVLSERPIQGHAGINRRADNQIVDANGRTRLVVESERRPNGSYHIARVTELEGVGIIVQTRPPSIW